MSRLGARMGRLVRIIRLLRLIRFTKLFKQLFRLPERMRAELTGDDGEHKSRVYESQLGKQLEEVTAVRVILLVLVIVFIDPVLSPSFVLSANRDLFPIGMDDVHLAYGRFVTACGDSPLSLSTMAARTNYEQQILLYALRGTPTTNPSSRLAWISMVTDIIDDPCLVDANGPQLTNLSALNTFDASENLLLRLTTGWTDVCGDGIGVSLSHQSCPNQDLPSYRSSAYASLPADSENFHFEAISDDSENSVADAKQSLYRTLCLIAIVAFAITAFSREAFALVLKPVERMMIKVERIKMNPSLAAHMDDRDGQAAELIRMRALERFNSATNPVSRWYFRRQLIRLNQTSLETVMLERTITRIGGLLAVGFGEAGAELVSRSISLPVSSSRAIVGPGTRVEAIFGCIRIENFSTIAAVLQDKVMLFVNQVCEIVHGVVDEFHGISSRNSGESILVCWKLDTDHRVHDMALAACVKMLIAVRRSVQLEEYRHLPPLMQRISNFSVQLSIGLHRGWAIEGAIGSNLKIDPSYLSPDVNTAEILGAANADYATRILCSETVVDACSPKMAAMLRPVDKVWIRSATEPMRIFSLDMDRTCTLPIPADLNGRPTVAPSVVNRFIQRTQRDGRKEGKWQISDFFKYLMQDEHFPNLRRIYIDNGQFTPLFEKGFVNYLTGEWPTAKEALQEAQAILPDGPSRFLLQYMKRFDYVAPAGWKGFRRLDEKSGISSLQSRRPN